MSTRGHLSCSLTVWSVCVCVCVCVYVNSQPSLTELSRTWTAQTFVLHLSFAWHNLLTLLRKCKVCVSISISVWTRIEARKRKENQIKCADQCFSTWRQIRWKKAEQQGTATAIWWGFSVQGVTGNLLFSLNRQTRWERTTNICQTTTIDLTRHWPITAFLQNTLTSNHAAYRERCDIYKKTLRTP